MDVQTIKDRMKALIDQRNISFYKLAKLSGLTEVCVRNWFAPARNYTPSLAGVLAVCNGLEVSVAQLLCAADETFYPVRKREKELLDNLRLLDNDQLYAIETLVNVMVKKPYGQDEL